MPRKTNKTKSDNQALANLIGRVIDQKTKTVLATKDDLKRFATKDDLNNAVKGLATKTDFADVMWELKTMREENTVLADTKRQVNEHEDRLEVVEQKLNLPLAA